MSTISLTLDEIFDLAKKTLLANGCDDETASILSDLIRNAERDVQFLMDYLDYLLIFQV
jgi:delta1-piperideine-2-carboxylate reductase